MKTIIVNRIIKEKEKYFEDLASENFKNWLEAVWSWDPKLAAWLYSDDCTFLPTVSWKIHKNKEEAEEYFIEFQKRKPCAVIEEEKVHAIDNKNYLHSWSYKFTLIIDWEKNDVDARFSFFWTMNNNWKWEILHHHSSVKPNII